MPHITLSKQSTSRPSLEFYSDSSGETRRVVIEHGPFKIGRSETADLRIESVEVSREHAELIERNGIWLLRDLGSTNGTHVNGKLIKEALLSDGDILKVAETELTFVASAAAQFQRMVTQPIRAKKPEDVASALPVEITTARMLTEATLWQATQVHLMVAGALRGGELEAYFAKPNWNARRTMLDLSHPVCDRYRELERLRAVELALEHDKTPRLFLPVDQAEMESPHRLFSSLKQLAELLGHGWELGLTISLPIDVDILRIGNIHRQAREQELLIAFDEFQGNGGQVMHLESLLPDYLVLDSSMTKDLSSTRQPLRRLESLLSASHELAIKPVLPSIHSQEDVARCREIGFELMLHVSTGVSRHAPQADVTAS